MAEARFCNWCRPRTKKKSKANELGCVTIAASLPPPITVARELTLGIKAQPIYLGSVTAALSNGGIMRIGENACPICRSGSGPLIFPNISSVKVVNTEEMRKENERIVAEYEKRMKKLAAAEMLADAITTLG